MSNLTPPNDLRGDLTQAYEACLQSFPGQRSQPDFRHNAAGLYKQADRADQNNRFPLNLFPGNGGEAGKQKAANLWAQANHDSTCETQLQQGRHRAHRAAPQVPPQGPGAYLPKMPGQPGFWEQESAVNAAIWQLQNQGTR